MALSVREALSQVGVEIGMDRDDFLHAYLDMHLAPCVPPRYRRLVSEVLWRLPDWWDRHREWSVTVSQEQHRRGAYGSARREAEEGEGDDDDSMVAAGVVPEVQRSILRWQTTQV